MSKGIKHQSHSSKNEGDVSVVVEMMHYWPQRPLFEAAVLRLERLNLLRWVDQYGQDLANAGLNSAFDWDNFDICDQTSYAWS